MFEKNSILPSGYFIRSIASGSSFALLVLGLKVSMMRTYSINNGGSLFQSQQTALLRTVAPQDRNLHRAPLFIEARIYNRKKKVTNEKSDIGRDVTGT